MSVYIESHLCQHIYGHIYVGIYLVPFVSIYIWLHWCQHISRYIYVSTYFVTFLSRYIWSHFCQDIFGHIYVSTYLVTFMSIPIWLHYVSIHRVIFMSAHICHYILGDIYDGLEAHLCWHLREVTVAFSEEFILLPRILYVVNILIEDFPQLQIAKASLVIVDGHNLLSRCILVVVAALYGNCQGAGRCQRWLALWGVTHHYRQQVSVPLQCRPLVASSCGYDVAFIFATSCLYCNPACNRWPIWMYPACNRWPIWVNPACNRWPTRLYPVCNRWTTWVYPECNRWLTRVVHGASF